MKQIFTLLACLALAMTANAQIETIDWPGSAFVNMDETQTEVAVDIQNVSSQTLDLRISASIETFVSGAEYRICWGPVCHEWVSDDFTTPLGNNNNLVVQMAPDEISTTFYTDYKHNDNAGTSIIEYCWFDINDESIESCFPLTWHTEALSINDPVQAEISEISPNPVVGTSSIGYQIHGSFKKANIQIYSLVGELVQDISVNSPMGLFLVNAADFNAGIYFVNIIVDGQVQSTKKMVVAK